MAATWETHGQLDRVRTQPRWQGAALKVVTADDDPSAPPAGSPFSSWQDAAPFCGPLPWTLAPDATGSSAVAVKGVRSGWDPCPVSVRDHRIGWFDHAPFNRVRPVLASAFRIADVDYSWRAGLGRTAGAGAAVVAGWLATASLGASWWIYDRSELYRWSWLPRAAPPDPRRILVVAHRGAHHPLHRAADRRAAGVSSHTPWRRLDPAVWGGLLWLATVAAGAAGIGELTLVDEPA